MRFERRAKEQSGQPVGALIGGVLTVGAVAFALWLRLGLPLPVCHLREWTGIPCPTCGSTRLVVSLLAGRILEAAALNPLVFLALLSVVAWAVLSAARWALGLPTWRVVLGPRERRALPYLAGAALLIGWIYLIVRGV